MENGNGTVSIYPHIDETKSTKQSFKLVAPRMNPGGSLRPPT